MLIIQWLITACFLSTNGLIFAEEQGLYLSLQGGSEIQRESYNFESSSNNLQSEWKILINQNKRITAQCNKALAYDLYKAFKQCSITKLQMPVLEAGIGCRFQYVLPLAIEVKAMSSSATTQNSLLTPPNGRHLFLHPNIKTFLPISANNQLYARVGKLFTLTHNKVFFSHSKADIAKICNDIVETLLDTSPKAQWHHSMTLLGVGVVSKLTSKLEYDFSVNGYTQRNNTRIHFNASLGINYLF